MNYDIDFLTVNMPIIQNMYSRSILADILGIQPITEGMIDSLRFGFNVESESILMSEQDAWLHRLGIQI